MDNENVKNLTISTNAKKALNIEYCDARVWSVDTEVIMY